MRVKANWWPTLVKLMCSVCFTSLGEFPLSEIAGLGRSPVMCPRCKSHNVVAPDLQRFAATASAPLDKDNPPGRAEAFDAIVGQPLLRRAIEICLAGFHSLAVVGRAEDSWTDVQAILGDRAMLIARCPCGNYNRAQSPCTCTLTVIEAHRDSRPYRMALASDVLVETYSPKAEELWADYEPFTSVLGRIHYYRRMEQFNGQAQFEYDKKLEGRYIVRNEAFNLLDRARLKFDWGTAQLKSVQNVARTIATLDKAQTVGAVHMAEAITYRLPLSD